MPVERPTFSETWYRVADLRPRLRTTVQVYRQHFRRQMWHVIQDPSSNQFFRVNEPAYRFIAMLDGRRTVAQVWKVCNEQFGDSAPTQGEVIQLLGQLYVSNLLHAELPPDAEGLFQRYRKRVSREVKGYLTNLLFIRIPLFDPDRILDEFLSAVRWIYSWIGLVLLGVLLSAGGYFIIGRAGELVDQAKNVLQPDRLPLLFLSFWAVKAFHEFSHAFACKKFARDAGTLGEVHTMGIMFLVFTPMPFMDASSAWSFRSKWHRVIVNSAGMLIELGIASIAAIVWSKTSPGTTVHAIAYNIMFIASVSTLLFNANPLLRYDGYYILADLLEIANLQQRSRQYIYYLVRKYVWKVRRARSPANTRGERFWFVFYGIASTLYRIFIVTAILLFVANIFPFIGIVIAIGAATVMLLVPVGKFFKYLLTDGDLDRVRGRAIVSVLLLLCAIIAGLGLIPVPDRARVEGLVEPVKLAFVTPLTDGFVRSVTASDRKVHPDSDVLIESENPAKEAQLQVLLAERDSLQAQKRKAETESVAAAQSYRKAINALNQQIGDVREELEALNLRPPMAGRWISPRIERLAGAYVRRGQQIGLLASDEVVIVALAQQDVAPRAFEEISEGDEVEIRLRNRPDLELTGTVIEHLPAGQKDLPSRALGYAIGGEVQTARDDPKGLRATKPFFIIRIAPQSDSKVQLLSGQRVVIRLTTPSKPLAVQWWRAILQLVQRRFHV
ncbi:MAG: PqqD family peptide modification chaperone [Planctomycetota bacterium]|jgi:putative peptide zinc metalloprotease protein